MKLIRNGTILLIIALLGVLAVVGGEIYLHIAPRSVQPHTTQEIAQMEIGRVNINTATYEELLATPGITESTAKNIIDYRAEHSGFSSVEELLDVKGIGEKRYAQMAPYLTAE